jgi:hypothetical protein
LVGVEDLWHTVVLNGLLQCLDTKARVQRVRDASGWIFG